MNTAATYRSRPVEVTAIRWAGLDNCEAVFARIGWPHEPHGPDTDAHYIETPDGRWAEPGDWIVHLGNSQFQVLTDREFHDEYEPVPVRTNPPIDATSPIGRLRLPVRVYNRLRASGIDTVGQLTRYTDAELMDIKSFGVGSVASVENALQAHGFTLTADPAVNHA